MALSRNFLLLLAALLLILSIAFVLPFLEFFLLALLLAYLLMPVQKHLESWIRPKFAAAVIVAASTVVVILPLLYVATRTASEATELITAIREGDITFAAMERNIAGLTGVQIDIASAIQSAISDVQVDNLVSVFGAVTHVLIGVGLTLFLLFYFLKDRASLMQWLRQTVPLPEDVQGRLYEEIDRITEAVLVGHGFVALIQGILAGIGLAVAGIPNATFWTIVMVVLSLLPVVGSFLVWGPAVFHLFLNGQMIAAAGLFLWGVVVVGVSDDYLRPIVVDRYAKVNPSVIVIGVLGGIYVIGVMGIFFGPVVIGMLRAVLDIYRDEYRTDIAR